MIISDLQYI